MKNIKLYGYMLVSMLLLVSCNDFLSERPSKSDSVIPSTIEDMETILAGMFRGDNISTDLLYGNGDVALSADLEKMRPGAYPVNVVQSATWERKESCTNKDYMWMYRYQNIFRSNLVDYSLKTKVEAPEEQKNEKRAESAFLRAMSYMELANLYILPYCEANLKEPGLVLTRQTGYDYSLKRSTIEETYNFIEEDIKAALGIKATIKSPMGANLPHRVTNAAANALASRFYLMKHDYENSKKYAEAALDLYGYDKLIDYNTIGFYPVKDEGSIVIDGETIDFEVEYPNTHFNFNPLSWTEDYFSVTTAGGAFVLGFSTDYLPSESHIRTFDEDGGKEFDARWKYFYVRNYTYLNDRPVDIPYYMKPAGTYTLSVPEMICNVAECQARLGKWEEGLSTIDKLRVKRIDPAGKVNLTASSKDEAIAEILRERRREMGPLKRMWDVRRYNSNDYPADDVTLEQHFFSYTTAAVDISSEIKTYTLKPGDRRIAVMIPVNDVLSSKGELEQNTY